MDDNFLTLFDPLIRQWFIERVGTPTDVQRRAWPIIAEGRHTLVTAPTGSGKTLTAFLWGINQLLTGAWEPGAVRMLYISPLKALNNDIRRNLLSPLHEIEEYYARAGRPFPSINVLTRSGDTEQVERRRMLRHPPEILITTPESLNLLLSSPRSRELLTGIETVILDEIHAVAGSKRGTHLMSGVERVAVMSGEFQRVALSATVKPLDSVAAFIGGSLVEYESDGSARYVPRPVSIVEAASAKRYDIRVIFPENVREGDRSDWWPAIAREIKTIIRRNRSTLVFTNNRRLCEKISLLLNEDEPHHIAYAHHGSLSRETRLVVEERLKRGELAAIVATSSLELGIDIGALDEVVLVETPNAVASAVQRVGRAGHKVGEVSRGSLLPVHGRDFLNAAVVAKCIAEQDIEEIHIIECPLDVLAQVILSMTLTETYSIDRLFDAVRASYPYRNLSRRQFDLVLEMLAGRYSDARLREMKPRVIIDGIERTVRAREGAARLLYLSGGTIPDRGYFTLRTFGGNARIGELDEEFVWESRVGEAINLGTQTWRIRDITHNEVLVEPAGRRPAKTPFWRAEEMHRGAHLSDKVAQFLEWMNSRLDDPLLADILQDEYGMTPPAAGELIRFLTWQKKASGTDLPHRYHIVAEHTALHADTSVSRHTILHTLWGGRINRPLALMLAAAWEEHHGHALDVYADNDCISLDLPAEYSATHALQLVAGADIEKLLKRRLENSGYFGARFRENAGRALLLSRERFDRRTPLWITRQRSKKLLQNVAKYPDFPIIVETWRTCLRDEFDLPGIRQRLDEITAGVIAVSEIHTPGPTPFAQSMTFLQTNALMYADDTPTSGWASNLSDELLRELVERAELRPEISGTLLEEFRLKAQRVANGYAPRSNDDLLEWVKERILIPQDEWDELQAAIQRDAGQPLDLTPAAHKIVRIHPPNAAVSSVAAVEMIPRIARALRVKPEELKPETLAEGVSPASFPWHKQHEDAADPLIEIVAEWLRYYGLIERNEIIQVFGLPDDQLNEILDALLSERSIAVDVVPQPDVPAHICDSENLEMILRLSRAKARPSFKALPPEILQLFLAQWQGLTQRGSDIEDLQDRIEKLFGHPGPAALWETDILPARVWPYQKAWLDSLSQETELAWLGCGKGRITLALPENLDLLPHTPAAADRTTIPEGLNHIFPDASGRYPFDALLRNSGLSSGELARRLWVEVWKGRVANDTFAVLRTGIETRFEVPETLPVPQRTGRRTGFARWKTTRPFGGSWYVVTPSPPPSDALEADELNKDRARLLLDRYGIIFRELLSHELPGLRWGDLFRALRLMELSGEIIAGHFFEGITGLQFISQSAWRRLNEPLDTDAIYWMNAADAASTCGLGIPDISGRLPARLATTHLVYHGTEPVIISTKSGRDLVINVPPDSPKLAEYFAFIQEQMNRQFHPPGVITIEKINGERAHASDYVDTLRRLFELTADYRSVKIWNRY